MKVATRTKPPDLCDQPQFGAGKEEPVAELVIAHGVRAHAYRMRILRVQKTQLRRDQLEGIGFASKVDDLGQQLTSSAIV